VHLGLYRIKYTPRRKEGLADILLLLIGLTLTKTVAGRCQDSQYNISSNITSLRYKPIGTPLSFLLSLLIRSE
jgi:hypothetical protein